MNVFKVLETRKDRAAPKKEDEMASVANLEAFRGQWSRSSWWSSEAG